MNFKKMFFLFLFFISHQVFSQGNLSGVIKNVDQIPVSNAIVQLLLNDDVIFYTTTNNEGFFVLKYTKLENYNIEINAFNYKKKSTSINLISFDSKPIEIILDIETRNLEEVVVLGNSNAMKQKGDTLLYNLKSFTNGSERNLKDILNKLPGIDIDENGQIKVNGKAVDKLLVDGQEFFGDNHQMATENLNAEMIGGVDVYNNYTNNSNIKDIEGSEKTALNIKINEGYKGKITGNLSAFSGYDNRYKTGANLFRFDKKMNLSFIENLNNTNEETISLMEYFNMNKSIKNDLNNNKTSNFSTNDDIPTRLLSNDNVINKEITFGALNFSYFPSSKIKIEGFTIVNNNFQKEQIFSSNKFFQDVSPISTSETIGAKGKFLFNQTKIKSEYKINNKSILNYSLIIEPTKDNQQKDIYQIISSTANNLLENQNTHKTKFGQQLSFINRLASNKLMTLNAYQELFIEDNIYNLKSDLLKFNIGNNFEQYKNYRENEFGFLGKYAIKIKKNILAFGISYTSLNQNFNSNSNNTFNNNIKLKRDNFSLECSLSKRNGFWQYLFENKLTYFLNDFNKQNNIFYLPKAQLKLELKSTSNITLNYQKQIQFPNANQVFNNTLIQNYYTINKGGNLNIFQPILSNNFGLSYLFIDLFSGTIVFSSINYIESKNTITTNSTYQQNISEISNLYANNNKNLNFNLSFERKLKILKSRIKSSISFSKINGINYINNIENNYQNIIAFFKIGLISRFKNPIFNYNIGYETQFVETKYQINLSELKKNIYKPFINFEGKISKNINYHLDNSYSIYKSQNIERRFFKTVFEISVKPQLTKWEFYIKGNDILNLKSTQIIEVNLENNIEQTKILSRLPGYVGIGARYNL